MKSMNYYLAEITIFGDYDYETITLYRLVIADNEDNALDKVSSEYNDTPDKHIEITPTIV